METPEEITDEDESTEILAAESTATSSNDDLNKLVSEAVKKALGSKSAIPGTPSTSDNTVSQSIVSEIVENLKPTIEHTSKPSSTAMSEPPTPRTHRAYLPPTGIPQYKPTPISELKKRHIPVPYTPLPSPRGSLKVQAKRSNQSEDFTVKKRAKSDTMIRCGGLEGDDRESEKPFKTLAYSPKPVKPSLSHNGWSHTNKPSYEPSSIDSLSTGNTGYVPSPVTASTSSSEVPEYSPSGQASTEPNYVPEGPNSTQLEAKYVPTLRSELCEDIENIDFSSELSMIEKIFDETSNDSESVAKESEEHYGVDKKTLDSQIESDLVESESSALVSTDTIKEDRTEKSLLDSSEKGETSGRKHKRIEHRKSSSTEKVKTEKKDSSRSKSTSSSSSRKKERSKRESSSHKEHSSKHASSSKKSRSSSDHRHTDRKDRKHRSHSSESHSHHMSRLEKTSKEKLSKPRSREKRHSSSSSSKSEGNNNHKRSRPGSVKKDEDLVGTSSVMQPEDNLHADVPVSPGENQSVLQEPESDETDEETVTAECYQIFESFKSEDRQVATPKLPTAEVQELKDEERVPQAKKRVAHEGAIYNPPQVAAVPKLKAHPAEVMQSRYAATQGTQEKKSETQSSVIPSQTFLSSSFGGTVVPAGRIRIAHVPNVSMILNEKNRVQELMRRKQLGIQEKKESVESDSSTIQSTSGEQRTIAQSVSKGGQRVAHRPPGIPVLQPNLGVGKKIPISVRQSYLDLLSSEFAKFYSQKEAQTKALEEEAAIVQKCSTKAVYTSCVSNIITQIRRGRGSIDHSPTPSGSKVFSHSSILEGPSGGRDRGSWSVVQAKSLGQKENLYIQLAKYILSEEELVSNGFPRPHPTDKSGAVVQLNVFAKRNTLSSKSSTQMRICSRCGKVYNIDKRGFQTKEESCIYHWGKVFNVPGRASADRRYSCCHGDSESPGCAVSACHVSDYFDPDNMKGFVKTLPAETTPPNGDYGVFALDCEMCYTTVGLELARVTVIDREMNTVYETLIKPPNPVIDYNTRFSGITEEDMKDVTTTIYDVQASLLSMIHDKTILIGHSLESDLKVLKIIHNTVVDTSVVFPHRYGPPKKRALKNLCRDHLNKIIQESESGHDSAEDAKACMELMRWKLRQAL